MGSPHHTLHSKPMNRPHKCKKCGKSYAMDWALANHIKHCINLQ